MNETKLLDPITPGEILREDFMEPMSIGIKQFSFLPLKFVKIRVNSWAIF